VLGSADAVTACSQKTLDDAEAFYGKPLGARARVIFNGASLGDFESSPPYAHGRPYILAIGRLVPQKGFDVLLRAMATEGLQTHDLLLAGDGGERASLEKLAADLKLDGRVRFLGQVQRPQAASLFRSCDMVVFPSRADEGLPVVCAEAMAAGKPIIGTRVGGVPEAVVPERTGLIVAPEDPAELAVAIARLLADAPMRRSMGEAARQRAGMFSWPVIAGMYREVYGNVKVAKGRSVCLQ
jgi:glycosyltransferase involved in cell wall biosynthesis